MLTCYDIRMKTFLILLVCLVVIEVVYLKITKISFDNYKGKVSGLYCKLASLDNLPKDPVIFVPGIKGSTLEKGGKRAWLNFTDVISGGSDLKYSEDDGVKATGVFAGFKIAPFVAYEPYYKMTANVACAPNGYLFYYDWRDYPDTNSKKFGELVERVIKETGKKPSVVAHSMGGLVAHGYIKEHPENIEKIVYVSVPFQPGVSYFDDVNEGKPTGLNKSLMSKEVIFSQPASYLLMPHKGSGKYYGKELMEAKTWSDNKFSVFKDGTADIDQFQKMLDRVDTYHKLLDTPKTLDNKFLFIVGECYTTVLTIDKDGKRTYVPGDGRVSENASYPFDNLTDKKIEVFCRTHDEQMNDKDVIRKIFDFLN
jgi:pimeloyl-ACP methyl ester carboxylesterase